MAQTTRGEYRVVQIDSMGIHLQDVTRNQTVIVEKSLENYEPPLQSVVEGIEPGNMLEAELKSEDYIGNEGAFQDGLWYFSSIDAIVNTRFYSGRLPETRAAKALLEKLEDSEKSYVRSNLTEEDEVIGSIVVVDSNRQPPSKPVGEAEINKLNEISTPPFEAYNVPLDSEGRYLASYYFADLSSDLREVIHQNFDSM